LRSTLISQEHAETTASGRKQTRVTTCHLCSSYSLGTFFTFRTQYIAGIKVFTYRWSLV